MTSNCTRSRSRAFCHKAGVFRGSRHINDVTTQQGFRSLLLKAMDKHCRRYLKKRASQGPEFRSASVGVKLTNTACDNQNKPEFPFSSHRNKSGTRHEKPDATPDDKPCEDITKFDKKSKASKTLKGTAGYKKLFSEDHSTPDDNEKKTTVTESFYKHTIKHAQLKSSDVTSPRDHSNNDSDKEDNMTKKDAISLKGLDCERKSPDLQQRGECHGTRVLEEDTKGRSQQKTKLVFSGRTSLPYLILDHAIMEGNILDGRKNFLIIPHGRKAEQYPENPKPRRSIERREVGLQKLRKTFTERKVSKSQAVSNDSFHGDPGRQDYPSQREAGRSQTPNVLNSRRLLCPQRQENTTQLQQNYNGAMTCNIHINKSIPGRISSNDKRTKSLLGSAKLRGYHPNLCDTNTGLSKHKSIMPNVQKTKKRGLSLLRSTSSTPKPLEETDTTSGGGRQKVQTFDIKLKDTTGIDSIALMQGGKEVQEPGVNHSERSQGRLLALYGREAVTKYAIFNKRASSAESTPRVLTQTVASSKMRRARSLGNQEKELLSPSIKHKRRGLKASGSKIQRAHKVHFDHNFDEKILEYSQKETLKLLQRYPTDASQKRKRPLNSYSNPANVIHNGGEWQKQHNGISRYSISPVKGPSRPQDKDKNSPCSKSGIKDVKSIDHSQSPVRGCRSHKRSSNSSSPESCLVVSSVENLKLCCSLSPPPSKGKVEKTSSSQLKRMKENKISKTVVDSIQTTNTSFQHLDVNTIEHKKNSKPEGSKELLYSSRSPQILKTDNREGKETNAFCQNISVKARFVQTAENTFINQHSNQDCNGKTPSATLVGNAKQTGTSPPKGTGQVRKKLQGKEQTRNVKIAQHKPPVLFTEHRAQKRRKLKEKEANKQKNTKKLVSPRDKNSKFVSKNETSTLPVDNKELCGWENDMPEVLCFLQTSDQADFHMAGSNERCSFAQKKAVTESSSEQRLQLDKCQESVKLREEISAPDLEQLFGKESKLNPDGSHICNITQTLKKTSSDDLAWSSQLFVTSGRRKEVCNLKDRTLPYEHNIQSQQKTKRFTRHHSKQVLEEEKSENSPTYTTKEKGSYHYKREDVKQIVFSVLQSSHHMASYILEIREKIDILGKKVSQARGTKVRYRLDKSNSLNRQRIWTPTVFDYMKLVIFMGLQLLAQFVFVKKWY